MDSLVIFLPAQFKTAKSHGRKLAHNRISLFLNKIQKFMFMKSGTQFYAIQFTFENNNYRRSKMEPNTSETSGWHTIFYRHKLLRLRLTHFWSFDHKLNASIFGEGLILMKKYSWECVILERSVIRFINLALCESTNETRVRRLIFHIWPPPGPDIGVDILPTFNSHNIQFYRSNSLG